MQWPREDVLVLLCTLNLRIKEIRDATQANPKDGLHLASTIINKEIGDNGTNGKDREKAHNRVRRKINQLWDSFGSKDKDKDLYDLCLYGAIPNTLPRIDPLLLKDLVSEFEQKQK